MIKKNDFTINHVPQNFTLHLDLCHKAHSIQFQADQYLNYITRGFKIINKPEMRDTMKWSLKKRSECSAPGYPQDKADSTTSGLDSAEMAIHQNWSFVNTLETQFESHTTIKAWLGFRHPTPSQSDDTIQTKVTKHNN